MQYFLIFVALVLMFIHPSYSASITGPTFANDAVLVVAQARSMTQDDAARKVREATGGRVLNVQTIKEGDTTRFLVKVLLPSGTVRVVPIDGH